MVLLLQRVVILLVHPKFIDLVLQVSEEGVLVVSERLDNCDLLDHWWRHHGHSLRNAVASLDLPESDVVQRGGRARDVVTVCRAVRAVAALVHVSLN